MKKSLFVFTLFSFWFSLSNCIGQSFFFDGGAGIGNVVNKDHTLGKVELHLGMFKKLSYGDLGVEITVAGDFIPGDNSTSSAEQESILAGSSRFNMATFAYRLPVYKKFFIEPRIGYALLFQHIDSDETSTIYKSNLTSGIGIGTTIDRLTLSVRYQYLGNSPEFDGFNDSIRVLAEPDPLSVVMVGLYYRFYWKEIY
ncbi:MAG: hypothetical protein P1U56_05715 [Saprospiraceae bacterium]|nr:hypothetical protein [Saprospiraceae bacterium]